jgi:hypothetical protein
MGWRLVAVVGLMGLAGCSPDGAPEEARPDALDEFAGRDLRALGDADTARLTELLAAPLPERYGPARQRPGEPWHLWRHAGAARPHLLLFEGYPIHTIPGTSSAAVHFLTPAGQLVTSCEFSTGWRIDLEAAEYRIDPAVGPVIDVRTAPVINGRDIRREVYGVFEDRVGLLRVEGHGRPAVGQQLPRPEPHGRAGHAGVGGRGLGAGACVGGRRPGAGGTRLAGRGPRAGAAAHGRLLGGRRFRPPGGRGPAPAGSAGGGRAAGRLGARVGPGGGRGSAHGTRRVAGAGAAEPGAAADRAGSRRLPGV